MFCSAMRLCEYNIEVANHTDENDTDDYVQVMIMHDCSFSDISCLAMSIRSHSMQKTFYDQTDFACFVICVP